MKRLRRWPTKVTATYKRLQDRTQRSDLAADNQRILNLGREYYSSLPNAMKIKNNEMASPIPQSMPREQMFRCLKNGARVIVMWTNLFQYGGDDIDIIGGNNRVVSSAFYRGRRRPPL